MPANAYDSIITKVFFDNFQTGASQVNFIRQDLADAAEELGLVVRNLGDIIYSFRYRKDLPESVRSVAPASKNWLIMSAGSAKYSFLAASFTTIEPRMQLVETKIPDATPGLISKHAMNDEQALLARVRYNRLLDIFTGVTCYSLQSHLRTQVVELVS